MTANETTFALDIDGEEETFDRHAPELTRIYWKNGSDKAKRQPGSFYVAANDLTTAPLAPWAPSERYDEAGYETNQLTATVIGYRAQWFTLVSSVGGERKVWLKTYEEGARKLVEILAFVSGIDEPVVISSKGMVGKAFEDILRRHERRVLKAAEQLTGAHSLNRWAVAIPIASALDERGKVQYMEFKQGGSITPPSVAWPADAAVEDIVRLFWQDKATRARCADLRREYDSWLKERRGEDVAASAPTTYAPMEEVSVPDMRPQARNVPVAVGETEDLPF